MKVRSLGQEYPLEKQMATHSSILAWEIPWTEEPGQLHSTWGPKRQDPTELLNNSSKVPSKPSLDPSQAPSNCTESVFQETLTQAPFY